MLIFLLKIYGMLTMLMRQSLMMSRWTMQHGQQRGTHGHNRCGTPGETLELCMAELGGGGMGNGEGVEGHAVVVVVAAARGARQPLRWTSVMSTFVLQRFVTLVGEGVKTDKGLKEVRVCKLKKLSGSLWDEDNYMITLDEEHYAGHVKDNPKDEEYLNKPIEHYLAMQIIFGGGVATDRFAMGSNEPLGQPPSHDESVESPPAKPVDSTHCTKSTGNTGAPEAVVLGKRKRVALTEEEGAIMLGMTQVVGDVAAAMRESAHCEAAPRIYKAVMSTTGFTREALMFALDYLMTQKATTLVFVEMEDEDRDLWLRTYLGKHYYN
ncbi:hypothetical protein QOZ80_2AG0142800 [Eleusine coracana subsp. coracana]|nr:hypothetical protein QOZ80_2AG0142800 [Eleusine coracana subsp. coracana]